MKSAAFLTATVALGIFAGALTVGAAEAVDQTKTCTDGAKRVWKAKAVWGNPYVAADGTTRVKIDYLGWTTSAQTVTTKAEVKTYRPVGQLIQTLASDHAFDYDAGQTWLNRNPKNPPSQPGKSEVTLKIGVRGAAACTLTFVQPELAATIPTAAPVAPTATPSPTATPTTPPVSAEAAVRHGWGTAFASDEFNYAGAPDKTKWSMYNSAGHANKGLRRPEQWTVNGAYARVTGNPSGTTGGMSFKPDRGSTYGRWEVRMRVPQRDVEYHPVLIVWPDAGRVAANNCQEIDFSEATTSLTTNKFFLHTGCSGQQTTVTKTIDMTQWHNYAVEWTPSRVTGYIDGVKWFEDTNAANIPRAASHLTMQLDWFPDGTATSTSYMDLDWARAYRP